MSSPKKKPSKKAAPKSPKKPRAKPAATAAFPSDAPDNWKAQATSIPTEWKEALAGKSDDTAPNNPEATTDTVSTEGAKRETKGKNQHTDSNTRREEQDSQQAGMRKAGTQAESTEQPTTQTETAAKNTGVGYIPLTVAETATVYLDRQPKDMPLARMRDGETRGQCWERLRQEARTAGMTRRDAITYAGVTVDQVWIAPLPPEPEQEPASEAVEPEPIPEPESVADPVEMSPIGDTASPDSGVAGLGDIPEAWGELPANAQLQTEIAWVSANRLRVRDGSGVNLSRALSPAPSYSALSWLETSILFPSKFADISVKATANQDDEKEHIRREKMAIEEIRSILAEML